MNNKIFDALLVVMFLGGMLVSISPTVYHFWTFGFEFQEFKLFKLYWPWYLTGGLFMLSAQVGLHLMNRKNKDVEEDISS